MNSMLRSSSAAATTRKLFGGQTLSFVRNAGGGHGPSMHPGASGFPFPPGPKQMQQLRNWMGTSVLFGASGFVGLCYFTDWKVVTAWIPFYNGKYKD